MEGLYQLVVESRGHFNTKAKVHSVAVGDSAPADADELKVEFVNAWDGVHPFTAIIELAVSTGQSAHHTSYDRLLGRTSPPLDPAHIDTDQFAEMESDFWWVPRLKWVMSKPKKLSELVSGWLAPFGCFIYSDRGGDGLYRIKIGQMLPPLRSSSSTAVGSGELRFDDPAGWRGGLNRVVNHIEVRPGYDPLKEENTDDLITQLQPDSIVDYGTKQKVTWKLVGMGTDTLTVAPLLAEAASNIFARLANPYLVLELRTSRAGLTISPGDTVSVTLDGLPTMEGDRGLSARTAVVLQVQRKWEAPVGGGDIGALVLVAIEHQVKTTTYSPSAYLDSYTGGTKTATVDTSAGFFATGETAADHFSAGDKVVVWNLGDASTRDSLTIDSVSGNSVVFTTTWTNASYVANETMMCFDDYTAVQTSQKVHAFIADGSTPPDLDGDDADVYV